MDLEKFKEDVLVELNSYLKRFKKESITDQQRADAWMLIATSVDTLQKFATIEGIMQNTENSKNSFV
jgi:hypothetical protein